MGFLLLIFLVFFAPLILFVGQYRAASFLTPDRITNTNSMACSFILLGESPPFRATSIGRIWSELSPHNGQLWSCYVRADRDGRYASRTRDPTTLRGGRLSLGNHTNHKESQNSEFEIRFLGHSAWGRRILRFCVSLCRW